ncbi:MAG: hypothetical protein G01um101456_735 [Parcubacteria group bacterium Gr01-1014_56]|nr:MAG: hypothetical protein G01um101456_735 [Parcubacteria group bacterium Gr01-1014_56]
MIRFWRIVRIISIASLVLTFGAIDANAAGKKKPKSLTAVTCLTRLILGEAGLESTKSRKAVAYVAVHYAKKLKRTVCKEFYSGRYSVTKCKRCMRIVIATAGEDWKKAKAVAIEMIENPVPPDPRLLGATTYVRWAHASKKGAGWIRQNTCRLAKSDVQIGKHVFRKECVQPETRVAASQPISSPPIPLRPKPKPPKFIALK